MVIFFCYICRLKCAIDQRVLRFVDGIDYQICFICRNRAIDQVIRNNRDYRAATSSK